MKLSDDGETVEFKSVSPSFERERDSQKCNTVRMFTNAAEQDRFVSALFGLVMVKIMNSETRESFERCISDVTCWTYPGFDTIYIISWREIK